MGVTAGEKGNEREAGGRQGERQARGTGWATGPWQAAGAWMQRTGAADGGPVAGSGCEADGRRQARRERRARGWWVHIRSQEGCVKSVVCKRHRDSTSSGSIIDVPSSSSGGGAWRIDNVASM
jgi:hypothetical protein